MCFYIWGTEDGYDIMKVKPKLISFIIIVIFFPLFSLYWNKTKQTNNTSGKENISMSGLCYFIVEFKVD